eukprot:1142231-Pelagomonas_calceolata.AAC.1
MGIPNPLSQPSDGAKTHAMPSCSTDQYFCMLGSQNRSHLALEQDTSVRIQSSLYLNAKCTAGHLSKLGTQNSHIRRNEQACIKCCALRAPVGPKKAWVSFAGFGYPACFVWGIMDLWWLQILSNIGPKADLRISGAIW